MPTTTRPRFSVLRVGLLTFAALVALVALAAVAVRSEYQPLPAIKKRPLRPPKPDPETIIIRDSATGEIREMARF